MPLTQFRVAEKYQYLSGFNCYHETEALKGAVPVGMNLPLKHPLGLYAEKFSGTAFTAPRHENSQAIVYRILPSSVQTPFERAQWRTSEMDACGRAKFEQVPNQLRWDPFEINETLDWVQSLQLIAGAGDPVMKSGLGIHIYGAGKDMDPRTAFTNADGEYLIVPQQGTLDIQTEMGWLLVRPHEICVIPRGIRFRVCLPDGPVRGFVLELYQGRFQLPELGPIGTNGLANIRDFQAPVASFDDDNGDKQVWKIFHKFAGGVFVATQTHTPFDVVGWHGNYCPYKYDLGRFNTIGSVSFDHPDPSIFTVLTAPSDHAGTAIADFVVFPPRWLVQNDTFRPPYFHRNCMSEFMGLLSGEYDGKEGGGFAPGGASLHNVMTAHGPDAKAVQKAYATDVLEPEWVGEGSLAFMFESCFMVGVTPWGLKGCGKVQDGYEHAAWGGLERRFRGPAKM